jgi:Tfp pilus assembly protein PilO
MESTYLVSTLMGVLIVLIGWIGNRIHNKLDEMASALRSIEKDLRNDLSSLDRRVSYLEGQHKNDWSKSSSRG